MVENSSRKHSSGPLVLHLGSSIPNNPFVNNAFPVQLYLMDSQRQLLQGIPVEMQVFLQGGESPLDFDDVCSIGSRDLVISNLGLLEFQCTFKQLSMNHGHRKFILKFLIKLSDIPDFYVNNKLSSNDEYMTISSHPIFVIRYRLLISLDIPNQFPPEETTAPPATNVLDGTNSSGKQHIWYKDEGGKDHGIDVTITLINEELEPILGQEIPLIISLTYANGENITMKSNLLSILPEGNLSIDKHTGKLCKKIRINDISKNHQRQSFRIRVQPDISKANTANNIVLNNAVSLFDIAGDESDAIEVRSKRTKRQRDALLGVTAATNSNPAPGGSVSISNNTNVGHSGTAYNIKTQLNSATIPILDASNNGPTSSSNKRFKVSNANGAMNAGDEHGVYPRSVGNSNNKAGFGSHSLDETNRNGFPTSNASNASNADNSSDVEQSFRTVLKWTENVIHGLQEIQWVPIGYPTIPHQPGGGKNVDWNKPYYQMNNPNVLVERLLTEYSNSVYHALSFLVKKRDLTSNNSPSAVSSSSNGAYKTNHSNSSNHSSSYPPSGNNTMPRNNANNPGMLNMLDPAAARPKRTIGKGRNYHQHPGSTNGHVSMPHPSLQPPNHHLGGPSMANHVPSSSSSVSSYHPGGPSSQHHHLQQEEDVFDDDDVHPPTLPGNGNSSGSNNHGMNLPGDDHYRQDWYNVINYIEQNNSVNSFSKTSHPDHLYNSNNANHSSLRSSNDHSGNIHEKNVYYILSLPYDIQKHELLQSVTQHNLFSSDDDDPNGRNHPELYFPAFDQRLQLLGFYTETKDSQDATVINFIPITSPLFFQENNSINMKELQEVLQSRISHSAPEVYSLPNANNDLELLKHNAIVHYWLSEVGLDEDEF